jgi:tRNA threonylcarbamoyladenosine biosynthesis protein TsaE
MDQFDQADDRLPRCFRSRAAEETRDFAHALATAIDAALPGGGLVISLTGELGAGKTVFVRGLAEGLGIDPSLVSSPTFVIANQYRSESGRLLNHVDFYRLESAGELETMGFFDLVDPVAVVAVEWGERFVRDLPRDHLALRLVRERAAKTSGSEAIEADFVDQRMIHATATGPSAQSVLDRWCADTALERPGQV